MAFGGKPRLPLIEPPLNSVNSIPTGEAKSVSPDSPTNDKLSQCELWVTDQRLLILSKTMDQQDLSQEDRAFLSAGIATAQHDLANLLADLELDETTQVSSFTRKSSHLAVLIFINLSLRQIVPNAGIHYIMVGRLKAIMEEGGNNILSTWDSDLKRLLWVAFIGGAAAPKRPDKSFFVKILQQLRDSLLISSLRQFQDILKAFGWVKAFSAPHSIALWFAMDGTAFADLLA